MPENVAKQVPPMLFVRLFFGIAAIFVPGPITKLMGFPADQVTTSAKLMGGLFGVREIALAFAGFHARNDPRRMFGVACLQSAVDVGDAAVFAGALKRREGVDKAAGSSLVAATGSALGWARIAAALKP